LTYSQDFDNEAWAKSDSTIASNVITAPDGTTTASKVIPDNGVGGYIYRMCSLTASQENTESIYVKAAGVNYIKYNTRLYDETYSGFGINLQTAEVTNIFPNNVVCTAEKVGGNGWIRIKLTGTSSATGNRILFYITPADADFSGFQGDGSSGVGLWAGQLEAGSEASWYIPTTATTVTKPAGVYSRLNPLAFKRTALWGASTNKVTCRKANPTDTTNITKAGDAAAVLSVVDESAGNLQTAKDRQGKIVDLTSICSTLKVYEFDNTGASEATAFTLGGAVGNTNAHSFGAFVKLLAGSADIRLSGNYGITNITESTYTHVASENVTPAESYRAFVFYLQPNAKIRVILPQLEESPYCTPPIFQDSNGDDPLTSLTRPATLCEADSAGALRGNNLALMGQVIPGASGQSYGFLMASYIDSDNSLSCYTNNTGASLLFVKRYAGTSVYPTVSLLHQKDVPFQYQAYLSSSYGMGIRVRYWLGMAWSAWTDWATDPDTQDAPIAETFEIGSRNGANQFAGNHQLFFPIWHADPKTYLENMEIAA
jgi:hypothetical protein